MVLASGALDSLPQDGHFVPMIRPICGGTHCDVCPALGAVTVLEPGFGGYDCDCTVLNSGIVPAFSCKPIAKTNRAVQKHGRGADGNRSETKFAMNKGQSAAVSERVADILAGRILSGALAPGIRIKQDELAAELNTSRIPVRDALRILESRGLVTMRANTGARVIALAKADIAAAFDIREKLEPMLLADSVSNFTSADFEALAELLAKGPEVDNPAGMLEHGRAFHLLTYRRHSSSLLAGIVERTWDAVQAYVLTTWRSMNLADAEGAREEHLREHRILYDAIMRGEIETAQAALVLHIRRIRAGVLSLFDEREMARAD